MSNRVEQTKTFIKSKPVVVFMKGTPDFPACGFSARAIHVLAEAGVARDKLASMDILEDPSMREVLREITQWPTIPQVFVGGEFIGGSDVVLEMFEKGELQTMLKEANAGE